MPLKMRLNRHLYGCHPLQWMDSKAELELISQAVHPLDEDQELIG